MMLAEAGICEKHPTVPLEIPPAAQAKSLSEMRLFVRSRPISSSILYA